VRYDEAALRAYADLARLRLHLDVSPATGSSVSDVVAGAVRDDPWFIEGGPRLVSASVADTGE
jgi:hypothetical protein